MPNHIHGILIIDKPFGKNNDNDGNRNVVSDNVGATRLPQPSKIKNEKMAAISPRSNSVSTIIRSYKSAVTKYANRLELKNGWQSRFHDHIIRDDAKYQRISNYIINNPMNWTADKFSLNK